MDFCKNGQKLIEESQHENILPYNVKNIYIKIKKKEITNRGNIKWNKFRYKFNFKNIKRRRKK